jgi:predicted metal-dependent peptidase
MAQRSEATTQALSALIGQQPFFAVLAFNLLEVVECETFPGTSQPNPTAATDSKRIYVNPKFMAKLSVPERIFVLAHEITHVILQHPERMRLYQDLGFGPDMKEWDQQKFNKAADYNINDHLNKAGVGKQPLDTLLNAQYGMDDLVDDIYCKLPDEPKQPGGGGGGWDQHMPAAPDAPDPSTRTAEIQRAVAQAAAAQRAMGTMPASLQRLIDEIIDPQVRWQDMIERTILCIYGNEEASWSKLNRRKLGVAPHIPWPGRIGNQAGEVVIEVDTSGSIGDRELAVFMGEVKGVLEQVRPEKIYLGYVDAALHNDELIEFDDPSELTAVAQRAGGGGGTDMTVIFREIEQRSLEPVACIILTDGYTGFGDEPEGYEVIWCITSPDIMAPWGTTVHVKLGD